MNLLIDIGNTNLHWARQDTAGLGPMAGVRHDRGLPLDLRSAWEALDPPRRVLVGNVGGADLGQAVARRARACWGLEAEFAVTRQDCLGLRVAYAQPTRLGVDRWLALLGALGRDAAAAAVVVDVGTAATFDVLAPAGRHLGGLILPGLTMMCNSLLAGTHILQGEQESAIEPWATDTGAAVAAGSLHALAALAERLHQRLWDRLSETGEVKAVAPPALLITGGDGPRIGPLITRPLELVPDLVLRGLARWASTSRTEVRT